MALVLKANKSVGGSPHQASVEVGQIIIGRLPSSHIVIPGEKVEAIHAMVEFDAPSGEARLFDMASDEGVYLNNKRIEVVEVLQPGDLIRIGDVEIAVVDMDAVAFQAASAIGSNLDAVDEAGGIESSEPPLEPGVSKSTAEKSSLKNDQQEEEDIVANSDPRSKDFKTQMRATRPASPSAGGNEGGDFGSEKIKENLFAPGKEKPGGSTLEVVAFWENAIVDVKHYGGRLKPGEAPRPSEVILGNEELDQLIGVGPKANTKGYLLGSAEGAKAKIFLNAEMKAKVRRTSRVEKIVGPAKFEISHQEMALVKHGPLHYFLKNVSLPNPVLRSFQDADGKPIIFVYAFLLYALMVGGILILPPPAQKDVYDEEIWAQVLTIRTPTPKPVNPKLPPPKPVVEVEKPKQTPPPPVKPTPAPIVADKKPTATKEPPKPQPTPTKVTALQTPPKVTTPEKPPVPAKGRDRNSTDKSLGPTTAAKAEGNSGSKAAGTQGAFASQRKGTSTNDTMGVEGGKPNVMSGINLAKLGTGIGHVSDVAGIGAIATGLKSQAGGAGGGSGSAAKSSGFGGLGSGSSLNTGGVGKALDGLGGGADGAGKGGLGDPNGRNGAAGRKIEAQAVVVPQGDPTIEGALDRSEIEAVIKQNLAQIRNCYERNLQGNRGLAGRVKVAFLIKSSGRVQDSSIVSSDLNNPATESCITSVIRRWKFPLPRGGGVVNVNYPFVFSAR